MKLPFIGGAYAGRSKNANAQTCKNLFVEPDPSEPEGSLLVGTPGYTDMAATGGFATGQVRALHYPGYGGLIYAVVGNRFYSYNLSTNAFTRLDTLGPAGTLAASTGPVSMASSGDATGFIVVADGDSVYVYDPSGGGSWTALANPSAAYTATVLDGRLILDDAGSGNSGRFWYSEVLDFATVSAFNYATAEGSPDSLRAVFADRRELYLFGDFTTEVFFSAGDANSPFQRYQGGFIQVGILARYTIARCDNSLVWLGQTERGGVAVYRMGNNYSPEIISTPQVNYLLRTEGFNTDTYAFSLQIGDHDWYVLTSPTNYTLVYDALTKDWFQWRSGTNDYHILTTAASVSNNTTQVTLVGTTTADGKLHQLGETTYTDNGAAIHRERTTQHVAKEQDRVTFSSLQLDCEEGTATVRGSTTVASAALAYGATAVVVAATPGSTATGDTVEITTDDGDVHLAVLTNVAGTTLTFANTPLTGSAAIGNTVRVFAPDTFTIEWSKDGGQGFGNAVTRHFSGKRAHRAMIYKLGTARQWTFRFKTSVAVRIALKGLIAKVYGEPA